jgi:ATP-dependent helicase/nuclease subunit B
MIHAAARQRGFVDGSAYCTFAQLLERCGGAPYRGRRFCSPLTSRIVLWSCAQQLKAGPFGAFIYQPAFARSALELLFELKKDMVSPRAFADAAECLSGSSGERARYLARLFASYEERLNSLRLADREDRMRSALDALNARGLPPTLRGLDQIEIAAIYDWPAVRLEFLLALANACERTGICLRLVLPGSGSASVDLTVDQVLAVLERRGQSLRSLEVLKWDAAGEELPLAGLGRVLFSGDYAPSQLTSIGDHLRLFSAPGPREEIQHIARQVRDRLDRGSAPEQVGIAFPALREEAEWAVEALNELGIPARTRRGAPLASTGAGRTALSLIPALEEDFPAHRMGRFLSSRYLPEASRGAPESPAALLALAGVRDNVVGTANGQGAYEVRLSELAARLESRGSAEQAREARQLIEHSRALISRLEQIPLSGPSATLLARWRRSLEQLGFHRSFRHPEPRGAEDTRLGEAILRALARDQLAAEALGQMAAALEESLRLACADALPVTRRAFQRWLEDAAADFNLAPKAARSGAVQVLDLRELVGHRFKHVLIGGMLDGRFPSRVTASPIFSVEDRLAINRALGREAFRSSAGEGETRIDWQLAESRLLFYLGLTASEGDVILSFPRTGARGEPQLPSPFFEEIERITQVDVETIPLRSAPGLREVYTEQQLRERAAIEALIPLELRIEEPQPAGRSLAQLFADEDWFRQARELASIERERLRFFSNPDVAPGPFSGGIWSGEVEAALHTALRFGPERPISSSVLGRFGNCAFQGFVRDMLHVGVPDISGEDLDAKGRGSFWHKFLELLIPKLKQQGMLDRPFSEISLQLLEDALGEAAALYQKSTHVGHPALWELSRKRAQTMARRLLQSRSRGLPFEGHEPAHAELRFGGADAPSKWREIKIPGGPGEEDVFVEGKIDRIDEADGALGVVDYKSGTVPSGKRAIERLLASEFQLPIYLFAARSVGSERVDGAWLSLKDGTPIFLSSLLASHAGQSVDELLATDPGERSRLERVGKKNLPNAIHGLLHKLRQGDFGIRPLDCAYCSYRAICRITERRLNEARDG